MCFNCIEMLFNVVFHFPFAVLGKWQHSGKEVELSLEGSGLFGESEVFPQQQT